MEPMKPMKPMARQAAWWPKDLGEPNSSGSQNDSRYAYFADARRLAVDTGGRVETYDTGDHRIQGFGQQQGQGSSMTFQTPDGPVSLDKLTPVE